MTPDYTLINVETTYLQMLKVPDHIEVGHVYTTPPTRLMKLEQPSTDYYRFIYNAVGGQWGWTKRTMMDDAELKAILENPFVDVWVMYFKGAPAGFFEFDRRTGNDIEITYFGVIPEFIGQGMGRLLMYNTISMAWQHNPHRLWLHTCTFDHPTALRFYLKSGFNIYDKRTDDEYYPTYFVEAWNKKQQLS